MSRCQSESTQRRALLDLGPETAGRVSLNNVTGTSSGGGGSRTRVRKWILQSLYVRSVTQCFARGGERATGPQTRAC